MSCFFLIFGGDFLSKEEEQKVPLNNDVMMKCLCGMCPVQAQSACSQPKIKMPILIDVLQKNYLTEKSKLGENNAKLYLTDAVVCLCFSQKSRITDDLLNVVCIEREKEGKFLTIPDFALDKHTARGKALGKGIDDFFLEGNKLENEAFINRYTERSKELQKNIAKYANP